MINKKKVVIAACVLISLIATVFIGIVTRNKIKNVVQISNEKSSFTIVADNIKSGEITKQTGFTITSTKDYTAEEMRNKIKLTDNIDYDIDKIGSGKYYLKSSEVNKDISILNININEDNDEPELSWAFQTEQNFRVVSTIPTKDYNYANIDSGIEIEFSKLPESLDGYFEIVPEVKGRYESVGKTLIFVPEKLDYDTEYTVTIKKGLKSKLGGKLEEDYSFKFKTETDYNRDEILFMAYDNTVSLSDAKFIEVYANKEFLSEKLNITLYKLSNNEDYFKALEDPSLLDLTKLNCVGNFEASIIDQEIILPDNLEEGQYLINISTGNGVGKTKNRNIRTTLQVTDIATYIQSFNGETLVWCNDIATNEVIKNAKVQIGNEVKTTDNDGIAIFNISSDKTQNISVIDDKNRSYFTAKKLNEKEPLIFDDLYYSYLYTDREVYMPTDTINFWGTILPKKSGVEIPKEIEIKFENEIIKVAVNSDGNFNGKYEFKNRISGAMVIYITANGYSEYYGYKNITEYGKPVYKLTSSFDKSYYKYGDKINMNVEAEFFDGTPASSLNLKASFSGDSKEIVTNEKGKAVATFKPERRNRYGYQEWKPYNISTSVYTTGGEEDASTYDSVLFYPTNYMFNSKWENDTITLNANVIDIKDSTGEKYEKGKPANAKGKITIIKEESIKEKVGEYYDYINKKNVDKYKYSTRKTEVATIDFSFNGEYIIETSYQKEKGVTYRAEINYNFDDGFSGKETETLKNTINANDNPENNYYSFSFEPYNFNTNEDIKISIKENNANDFINKGRIIYTVLTDEIKSKGIITDTNIDIKFLKEYIPYAQIVGAYFDGKVIYPIRSEYLWFDKTERNLNIDIQTDKKSYKPGDKVKVNVTVKDNNGTPRKANMIISAVDEAVFAVWEQYPEPLSNLYEARYYEYISQFVSHQANDGYGSEGGGEGEPERSVFEDTAAFIPITTNNKGQGSAEFNLPDNLTSWRITAVGITSDIYAGYNKHNITTNLPFFINQVINTKYASGDDFTFSARAVGDDSKFSGKPIEYTSTIAGNGIAKELSFTKNYGETAIFNYGKLPEGEYEVYVKAKCGDNSDAIRKNILVYNSLQEIDISKEIDLYKELEVQALRFPVRLKFYEENNKLYYNTISKILSTSYGSTADQILSRKLTYKRRSEIEGIEWDENIRISQDYYGGVKLLPQSGADVLLTAKICALAKEYIDSAAAKKYFNNIINDSESTSSQVSAAYFGLAALKEPVLNDIKYLLDNNKGFEINDNMNFILGLAFIGDSAGANQYYSKLFAPKLKQEEEGIYLDISNADENYRLTSNLAMMLIKVNNRDFKPVVKYVIDKKSDKYTPAIDLLTYVLMYNPKKDSKGYVEYIINGEKEKITFGDSYIKTLTLNEDDLKTFKITSIENVVGDVHYVGGIQDAISEKDNSIKVTKTYDLESKVGDSKIITLHIKFPSNLPKKTYYSVSDIVPSGMRFVSTVKNNYRWYLDEEENQRLYFSVYNETGEVTITYKVRSLLPGEYVMESAVVSNSTSGVTGYSERGSVKINEK